MRQDTLGNLRWRQPASPGMIARARTFRMAGMASPPRPRALIVGGSLGGLFAGACLLRAGWDVLAIERTAGKLAGRGAGLGVHAPLVEGLRRAGAVADETLGVPVSGRVTLGRDGAIVVEIEMPQFCTSWSRL